MDSLRDKLKLYLITNQANQSVHSYIEIIKEAIRGGVTMVQLRDKSRNIDQIQEIAIELKRILAPLKIPLIINDHVELAKQVDADGVHLGRGDMVISDARNSLGVNKIIGVSIENMTDLAAMNKLSGNYYVAASAVFKSSTKLNCNKIWGLDGLKQLVRNSIHPVVAIGNINQNNIQDVIKAGAVGVAVTSAIHNFPAFKAAQNLCKQLEIKYD